MIIVVLGMSLLFFAIGLLVTERNAKYLLSGYNTMGEDERKSFDLHAYIPRFRKFHIFLGASFLVIGGILTMLSPEAGGVFLDVYPIVAYISFIVANRRFASPGSRAWTWVAAGILFLALVFVCTLFALGFRNDIITASDQGIEISGSYGEWIPKDEIKSIELVGDIPHLESKQNGFAVGPIRKGMFRSSDGELLKLILNSGRKPYLLIIKVDGQKLYYSPKDDSIENLFKEIKSLTRSGTHEVQG